MPTRPRHAILGAIVLFLAIVVVAGWSDEAGAQVFQGTIDFDNLPPLVMTVTLQPGGAATYTMTLGGRTIDFGVVVASVNGSSVSGFAQSTRFLVGPCRFQGTFDGTVANMTLDAPSCGAGGTLILTRVA
jgi:hypothetical protein